MMIYEPFIEVQSRFVVVNIRLRSGCTPRLGLEYEKGNRGAMKTGSPHQARVKTPTFQPGPVFRRTMYLCQMEIIEKRLPMWRRVWIIIKKVILPKKSCCR
jgi:hypothetical protein